MDVVIVKASSLLEIETLIIRVELKLIFIYKNHLLGFTSMIGYIPLDVPGRFRNIPLSGKFPYRDVFPPIRTRRGC